MNENTQIEMKPDICCLTGSVMICTNAPNHNNEPRKMLAIKKEIREKRTCFKVFFEEF